MKLGISGQALGEVMSFADIVKLGKKYGVTEYEIWPCNAGADWDYREGSLDDVKKTARDEGVHICCVTLGAGFSAEAAADPGRYAEYLLHAVDAAAELGAPVVNHYCGAVNPGTQPDFNVLEQYWRAPLERAGKLGIIMALENEAHDCTSTPEKMRRILEYFNHPNFKTNFDAVNYFHASCEGFPGAYKALRPFIGYVHLKNACLYDPQAGQPDENRGEPMSGLYAPSPIQYTPIPEGAVNIPALLTSLERDGEYTGVCTLEPHTTPEHVEEFYAKESAWLRSLGFFRNQESGRDTAC